MPAATRVTPIVLALLVVAARVLYLSVSGPFLWEDALISLRYAENFLDGRGFAYNPGERVLGSTAPLYVVFLAFLRAVTGSAFWLCWTISSLVAEGITAYTIAALLLRWPALRAAAALFTLFFAVSPVMNEVCLSGMETPLVLMLMSLLARAVVEDRPRRSGILAALLCLTRVDGVLFAAASLTALAWGRRDRMREAGRSFAAVLLPCLLADLLYFGEILPNTIAAKRIAYGYPVYRMVPAVWKAYLAQTGPFAVLVPLGAWFVATQYPRLLFFIAFDVLYIAFLVASGSYLFPWYIAPGMLAHYVAAVIGAQGLAGLVPSRAARVALLGVVAAGVLWYFQPKAAAGARWQKWMQAYETGVRVVAGRILRDETPPSSTVLLEPIGYIGYYSERYVYDAVGLVSRQMLDIRARHRGDWLYHMAVAAEPDYIVAREGFQDPGLYLKPHQRAEIERRYAVVRTIPTTEPLLPGMIILQRRTGAATGSAAR